MTLPVFVSEVEERWGHSFSPARPYTFTSNIDNYGWTQGRDGNYHFTVFIENGRIEDSVRHQFKSGLREIATVHKGDFRLTANQHVVISDIRPEDKEEIGRIMGKWGLDNLGQSGLRLSSSACVAFPSCSLAFAEAERYVLPFISSACSLTRIAGTCRSSSVNLSK